MTVDELAMWLSELVRCWHFSEVAPVAFGGRSRLQSGLWQAVHELDPDEEGERNLAGGREGHLAELFHEAGLREIEETALPIRVEHATFEQFELSAMRCHVPTSKE